MIHFMGSRELAAGLFAGRVHECTAPGPVPPDVIALHHPNVSPLMFEPGCKCADCGYRASFAPRERPSA